MKRERSARQRSRTANLLRSVAQILGFGLLIASIVRELRLPKEERSWHGVVFGKVPYDLRPPTLGRVQAVLWNPQNADVLVPTAFGVGWTVNLASLRRHVASLVAG